MEALEHDAERLAPEDRELVLAEAGKSCPAMTTLPVVGRSSPPSSISSEVLPLPEGPTMATTCAAATSSETLRRICSGAEPTLSV